MTDIAEAPTAAVQRAQRLNVLFINDTSRNGGPGRTILYVMKYLDPALVRRTVVIPREGIVTRRIAEQRAAEEIVVETDLIENFFEPMSRPMERQDFDAPLPVKYARAVGNVVRAVAGLVSLTRRVKRERYDLIFCNGTTAGFIGGTIAALTGTPAIWHVLYPSVPDIVRPLHRKLAAARTTGAIICVSTAVALQFAAVKDKVRMIQTALDIDEFDGKATAPLLRQELGLDAETVIFGSHGRILPRKGFIELVRAARIVIDKLGQEERARCRFIVLGDTPQDMRPDHLEECRALVRELGLDDYVQFIGFRPDPRPYVADFDVAVVPSVYEDPLPRAVMEAMAMGKPVVAFAMGGIGEMLADGHEGRLASGRPPDVEALASACLDYFRDGEMRRRHGLAARQRIEADFDSRKHGRKLQAEMARVVEAHRAP